MSSMSEDIQCAGSDTRPPMLDRTDFESWQQRIRLYCLGKDNGENIMKSINEGPFHMGTVSDVIAAETEGAFSTMSITCKSPFTTFQLKKGKVKADIRANKYPYIKYTKDIYSLKKIHTNHYTDAKDILGNEKMNLKLINDMRNIKMTMSRMQLNSKFVNNMLPEWSRFITEVKLNRGLKESNFDQLYAYLKQHEVHANENRTMMERFFQPTNDPLALVSNASVQQYPSQSSKSPQSSNEPSPADNFQLDSGSSSTENLIEKRRPNARNKATVQRRVVVQDVRGRYNVNNQGRPFQRNNARGNVVAGNVGGQNRGGNVNPGEQVTNFDDDVDESPENDLALNVDHIFEADQCDAFDSDVDEAPNVQTMFMVNLSSEDPIYDEAGPSHDSNTPFENHTNGLTEGERGFEQTKRCYLTEVIPFFKTLKQHFEGVQKALFKEVKGMEEIFDQMSAEVDQNTVDKQCAEIERKNLLIANENLIANCLSNQLMFVVEQSRCLDLEAEISKLQNENQKDVNDEMIRGFNKLEVEYLNLQLKYQHLQENFRNNKSQTSQDVPEFDSFFRIKILETQLQEKDNAIRNLKAQVSKMNDRSCETYNAKDVTALIEQNECVRVELEKVKQHYKELYDSIKITRVHTREKTSTMLNEIESLKAQLKSKVSCVTSDSVKPKVLAPGMYAIDVKPIPHPLKNNRSAHLTYINHLKESVETVREIVEEARVVKPLDNALNYACQYTKLSQELLEYVIGTCPKSFNERDNKAPSTPVTRKKQVTFNDKPGTSSSNTQKHEVHQKVQQTNVHVIHSTGVNTSTEASGSKPRSNTKKNRILPAKKENKKEVEVHLRTNKSVWTKVNRVDSSISSKRVVINSNSESVCKTCNKCLNSASHEMCVVNILNSVNATPTVKIVLNKGKQIWKPKGKLSDNSLNKTKQVWKATGKLFANVGYQWRSTGKKVALGKLNCGYQWRPTGKKFALGELCPSTKLSVQCCSKHMTGNRSKLKNFVEKFIGSVRFGNDHLGAIMGYGDYVIGDSVISRVYYVEGLGHNLFSVGQFCDSDLEVAFRKHTCFVRDINGTDILKGSRSTNLYTISIDEMMKSSPICLLSKASKSKSWLWHRRLNHLNFGTINDLARKDLVRGLPRLKFEKDHLCSACQLAKSKKFSHRPKSENTNMEVLYTLHMDLCGPMRVQSIKGKKYILVIVDDYSRFTWVKFLRSKDETPEFVINFLKQMQVGLNKTVRFICTDNGTEFVNQRMSEYYEGVGIFHQKSVPRTPQQNGVVERRNRTLVEAARTMMIFSKAPMFL
ncbi:retrovirus-related pol polyprotein from transposon TNT 1-94 [Tanacetum coccineum]